MAVSSPPVLIWCDIWLREIYCAPATLATYIATKDHPVQSSIVYLESSHLRNSFAPYLSPNHEDFRLVPRSTIRTNWLVSWYHVVSSGINWPNLIVHRLHHCGAIQNKADLFSCFLCHTRSPIASAFLITWERYVSKHQSGSFLRHPFFPFSVLSTDFKTVLMSQLSRFFMCGIQGKKRHDCTGKRYLRN